MPEPLSLMPGPSGDGVEVRADDDGLRGVAALRVREHVLGRGASRLSVEVAMWTGDGRPGRGASSSPTAKLAPSDGDRRGGAAERAV